jgi:hypothetical protein
MKKIMIVAAAVAMTFAGEAALSSLQPQKCTNCSDRVDGDYCNVAVFKVTGSGKAIVAKDDYKEVKKLKIKKGALALTATLCADTGFCCFGEEDSYFFAKIKAGKKSFELASVIEVGVWSVFGKKLDDIRSKEFKKGKTYKLDSALFIESAAGNTEVDGDADVDESSIEFYASAFGTMKVKISKKKDSYCNTSECIPEYTPKSYSGWFVGKYNCVGEEDCFLCECADTDVFGGTWKATFKSGTKTVSGAAGLAGVKFAADDDDDDDE